MVNNFRSPWTVQTLGRRLVFFVSVQLRPPWYCVRGPLASSSALVGTKCCSCKPDVSDYESTRANDVAAPTRLVSDQSDRGGAVCWRRRAGCRARHARAAGLGSAERAAYAPAKASAWAAHTSSWSVRQQAKGKESKGRSHCSPRTLSEAALECVRSAVPRQTGSGVPTRG